MAVRIRGPFLAVFSDWGLPEAIGRMIHYVNLTLGISMVFTIRKWETVIFEKTVYKMVWQKPF